jgi:hypothetical protein
VWWYEHFHIFATYEITLKLHILLQQMQSFLDNQFQIVVRRTDSNSHHVVSMRAAQHTLNRLEGLDLEKLSRDPDGAHVTLFPHFLISILRVSPDFVIVICFANIDAETIPFEIGYAEF